MKKMTLLMLAFFVFGARAGETSVAVEDAWMRAAPPNAHMLAAYVTVVNNSDNPIHLVGADSDAFGMTEIHRTVEIDGVFKMQEQPRLTIAVGEQLRMKPGGLHIMLMMPKQAFAIGESVDIVLHFEGADETSWSQNVSFEVKKEH